MSGRILRAGLAALLIHLALILPSHPAGLSWVALLRAPLELPVILAALLFVPPGRAAWALRGAIVLASTLLVLLKIGNIAMVSALGRGFNLVADFPLIEAGFRLLVGAIGPILATLSAFGAFVAMILAAMGLWWASGVWSRIKAKRPVTLGAACLSIVGAALIVADAGQALGRWSLPWQMPGSSTRNAEFAVKQTELASRTIRELRGFARLAAEDAFADRHGLLDAIDRDVLIVFVESYGRASFDTELYAATHVPTLRAAQETLGQEGLAMRSGWLEAPTRGGQSWLSHATFANGLRVADQISYRAMLASPRETLFHIAGRSGFHTAAVMPQITLDWPESSRMGFETVLASSDLGYKGLPFNWVTMPDQYTYSALDRMLRNDTSDRPVFAQFATGTSHAPWVPIPDLIGWDEVGDGQVFNEMALSGDTPKEVWLDRDRVRDQYRKAIDYALRVTFDYAALHADDPPLILVIGDHQAAGFVALDESYDVPMHVVGPPELVARIESWGFSDGLVPDAALPVRPMGEMRNLILEAFTNGADAGTGS
ncbi:Phosphoglycerol transferase MdoB [Roseivivax halotolerans]|uniref:Phosphoglycerol transferase MdoB n=1 Tax=Roseivivax halotolerans TaxID=93684 RepID=A0A1I5Y878_9RHOB|nr:sulfatase-like hydrolase/transferase [Roseivivax halotolerans]SFQ40406.1 Phosphoglycerol transferase MdoB [Roseivivax halotolerans]